MRRAVSTSSLAPRAVGGEPTVPALTGGGGSPEGHSRRRQASQSFDAPQKPPSFSDLHAKHLCSAQDHALNPRDPDEVGLPLDSKRDVQLATWLADMGLPDHLLSALVDLCARHGMPPGPETLAGLPAGEVLLPVVAASPPGHHEGLHAFAVALAAVAHPISMQKRASTRSKHASATPAAASPRTGAAGLFSTVQERLTGALQNSLPLSWHPATSGERTKTSKRRGGGAEAEAGSSNSGRIRAPAQLRAAQTGTSWFDQLGELMD
mmetsp:Transcript_30017/g.87422  ORF Transcript_30017/g.87422 Transcript_30017/m.87422 type:complete len:265 (-) Transcript_30017:92-886(-)